MKELIDKIIVEQLGHDPQTWPMAQGLYLVGMMLVGVLLTTFGAIFAGLLSWWERRIAARIQSRIGPNRVGPQGVLQFIADALKLILKEDLIPTDSDHILFRIAPYFVMTGFILTFVVLPFGYHLSATSMNVGLFYVVSITALVVVGILISGWASNSKWALFGGIRAAAQVVSYEIPAGMVILVPIIMAGSLNMHDIIRAQGGAPWDWFMFQTPWAYASFFIMFTALLAEGNRTPFDLPEAESEIVAGYNTEYSGMRFGYYFLAEWGNLWVMSAVLTTLFLGGWQVPFVSMAKLTAWEATGHVPLWYYLASAAVFTLKVLVLVNIIVWIRWTFPRIRVDQMMNLCWKYLVPIGMGLVVLAAVTELLSYQLFGEAAKGQAKVGSIRDTLHFAFFLVAGLVPFAAFALKTRRNIYIVGDRVDLSNW
ncbi:MAG TPA: NADH-quinone oxidoreductase subunit NuoH [Myxococcaceae bacterium]|nr:NADH-quinone oxidoreductase subunit NuoH [Myxococcaceae bacterium]